VLRLLALAGAVVALAGLVAMQLRPAAATKVTDVAAGEAHTCALTTAGGLKCWGWNFNGQLGQPGGPGSNVVLRPVDIWGLTSGVAAVAAGYAHTCALTMTGGLKCWGFNLSGQLGDGAVCGAASPYACTAPVDVSGLTSGVAAVAAGYTHTCALTTAGGAKCWGDNQVGGLGNGTTVGSSTPVDVSGLTSGVVAVAAGGFYSCAVTTAGGAKCWGSNYFGELGNGTTVDSGTPVDVSGLTSGIADLAAGGHHSCAITTAGGLKCWGWNDYGQLGNGTTTSSSTPVDVTGLTSGVASVAVGRFHSCAVTTAGGTMCWGHNGFGQLGNGTTTNSSTPVDVSGLMPGVTAVAVGDSHTCALTSAGDVECWGNNAQGQLGDGTVTNHAAPADVLIDSDQDGCADSRERREEAGSQGSGGLRNPKSFWDFYDVWTQPYPEYPQYIVRDQAITMADLLAVARRFGKSRPGGPPSESVAVAEALTPPPSAKNDEYHTALDRGPLIGPNAWDLGPPDGYISVGVDILGVARQFGHSCL
jgi:alpha-tubulin suppressor-like RCC1 family protein